MKSTQYTFCLLPLSIIILRFAQAVYMDSELLSVAEQYLIIWIIIYPFIS